MRSLLLTLFFLPQLAFGSALGRAESLIPNFHEVSTGVYRGGNPMRDPLDKSGLEALGDLGVKVVINLQGADRDGSFTGWVAGQLQSGELPENIAEERRALESLGIEVVNLPFTSHDAVDRNEAKLVQRAVALLGRASAERPVFVHCEHGVDRTGLVIALHRLQNRGWTVKDSYDEWVALGHDLMAWAVTGELDEYFFDVAGSGGYPVGM